MQTNGKPQDIQRLADRAQALARVSRNPEHKREASRLQARADRIRKVDKRILRAFKFGQSWSTSTELCDVIGVPPGASARQDYRKRLAALTASGKLIRRGEGLATEYRAADS